MTIHLSDHSLFSTRALEGRRILVTGASSGIGAHAAQLFSSLGAELILVARDSTRLNTVAAQLSSPRSLIKVVDLAYPDLIFNEIKNLPPSWLPIHGVFHASGNELVKPINMFKSSDFDCLVSPTAKAALSIGRAIASKGVMSDGGSFVLMSSVAAITGTPAMSVYSATKGAIESLTRSLAMELAPKSIRVNAITAGAIETPMHNRLLRGMPDDAQLHYKARHPLGFGQPCDISNLAAFLICDASRWITGTSVVVDGGYSAH